MSVSRHRASPHIEHQVARNDKRRTLSGALLCLPTRSPQDRRDPGYELARIEGLRQIVIRSKLQSKDAIKVIALRRQHEDGGRNLLSEIAQHIESLPIGEHNV